MNIICIGCLVGKFKHTFEHFKQYCTHFHIVFHPHIYQKHSNNITQTPLLNRPWICQTWVWVETWVCQIEI